MLRNLERVSCLEESPGEEEKLRPTFARKIILVNSFDIALSVVWRILENEKLSLVQHLLFSPSLQFVRIDGKGGNR